MTPETVITDREWATYWLRQVAASTRVTVEPSDIDRLVEYQVGIRAGTTTLRQLHAHMLALLDQYERRGASTAARTQDSQG